MLPSTSVVAEHCFQAREVRIEGIIFAKCFSRGPHSKIQHKSLDTTFCGEAIKIAGHVLPNAFVQRFSGFLVPAGGCPHIGFEALRHLSPRPLPLAAKPLLMLYCARLAKFAGIIATRRRPSRRPSRVAIFCRQLPKTNLWLSPLGAPNADIPLPANFGRRQPAGR